MTTTRASKPKTTKTKTTEPEQVEQVGIGEAGASGEHAYAGERADDVTYTRDTDAQAGTPEHLGDSPYAGSVS